MVCAALASTAIQTTKEPIIKKKEIRQRDKANRQG
jgi:hypothetical protein